MNRSGSRNSLLIAVAVILLLLVLYALFFAKKSYNWAELYYENAELPYGTSLLKTLLEESEQIGEVHHLTENLHASGMLDSMAQNSNYFYVGSELYLDSADIADLLAFTERGNTTFISSNYFSYPLLDSLFADTYFDLDSGFDMYDGYSDKLLNRTADTTINMAFYQSEEVITPCTYVIEHETIEKYWSYFRSYFETRNGEDVSLLGFFNDDYLNFIALPYGKGTIYLHSTPLALTNYAMMSEETYEYVNNALSYLGEGDVLWDSYNRDYRYQRGDYTPPGYRHEDGMLSFVLKNQALSWAWFTLLGAGLLFLIYGSRRKQRIIPVVNTPENSSIEYAETIGKLYRMEGDHSKLTRLKMRLFRAHVREKYGLKTTVEEHELPQLIEKLAEKSHLPVAQVKEIFDTYKAIEWLNDDRGTHLIKFHQILEKFYRNAR